MKAPNHLKSFIATCLAAATMAATCAQSVAQCCAGRTSANQPRIVGGSTAPLGAYPWMTALVERGQTPANGQFCGGALIHPQWVLTAGHCVEGTTAARLDVIVGAYDLRTTNGGGQRIQVIQIISHPQYGEIGGNLSNDVALLKLATPVTNVPVVQLVDNVAKIAAGQPCKGMGFGAITEGGATSPILLHVDLSVISLATANQVYPGLTSVHLAAGIPAGGRDTCQGDSGGPLVVPNGSGGWMHAGVVSYGDGCARAGVPGIYANTLTLAPWIQQQIGVQPPPPPVDDFGNTTATSASVALGAAVAGKLEAASDVDMFRVAVSGAGTLRAVSTGATALTGQLLNASGAVLTSQTGAPNFNVSATTTAAGTYYLAVKGATTATLGTYSLTLTFTPAPVTGAPEIDVSGKNAVSIPDGTTAVATANGTSFGSVNVGQTVSNAFTISNSGTANLTLGSVQLSGAGAAHFRVSVQPVTSLAAGRTATFTLVYAPTAAGTHVADVTLSNNDANENPYNFRLTGSAVAVSGDDHGNTLATATVVPVPVSRACKLEKSGDVDVFKFTVTTQATLTVRTTGGIDTYGVLYNGAGTYITEQDDYTDVNFRIRRTFAPGTYYIMVDGYDSTVMGSYTLSISP